MIRIRAVLPSLVAIVVAGGCSSNPSPGDTAAAADTTAAGARASGAYDRYRITPQEVQDATNRNITNAYDLVRTLRSGWINSRIVVYDNTTRIGGLEALRSYPLRNVGSMRFLSPSEAQGMFGLTVPAGAIQILPR